MNEQKAADFIHNFYEQKGFQVYPYSEAEVSAAEARLGKLPALLKAYLLTVGKIEAEDLFPIPLDVIEDWRVEDGMLIFSDFGTTFAIALNDFQKEELPVYHRGEIYSDGIEGFTYSNDWIEWKLIDDGEVFTNLLDFFVVALKDNTDIEIEVYHANRRLGDELNK